MTSAQNMIDTKKDIYLLLWLNKAQDLNRGHWQDQTYTNTYSFCQLFTDQADTFTSFLLTRPSSSPAVYRRLAGSCRYHLHQLPLDYWQDQTFTNTYSFCQLFTDDCQDQADKTFTSFLPMIVKTRQINFHQPSIEEWQDHADIIFTTCL